MTLIETTDAPLCPLVVDNPAHQAVNRTLDAFYDHVPKDDDGEMVGPAAEAFSNAAYGQPTMRLYRHQTSTRPGIGSSGLEIVDAAWWRCMVCGFVLPAAITARMR